MCENIYRQIIEDNINNIGIEKKVYENACRETMENRFICIKEIFKDKGYSITQRLENVSSDEKVVDVYYTINKLKVQCV